MKQLLLSGVALAFATASSLAAQAASPAPSSRPALVATALAQDSEEKPKPDGRPEVAKLVGQLEEHLKARGAEDDEAMRVIDGLSVEFEESGPKDRATIADVVASCVKVSRKDLAEKVPDQKLQTHAAKTLGAFGEDGGKELLKLVDHSALDGRMKARREAILSLGRTKIEKGVKVLIKLLDNAIYEVEGAAAQALGNYSDAKEKVRKEIVEALLKKIVPLADLLEDAGDYSGTGSASSNEDFEEKRKEYDALAAGSGSALAALTGHQEPDFRSWQRWWNDNKRETWS